MLLILVLLLLHELSLVTLLTHHHNHLTHLLHSRHLPFPLSPSRFLSFSHTLPLLPPCLPLPFPSSPLLSPLSISLTHPPTHSPTDYRWWWRSLLTSGSTAIYVFLYSIGKRNTWALHLSATLERNTLTLKWCYSQCYFLLFLFLKVCCFCSSICICFSSTVFFMFSIPSKKSSSLTYLLSLFFSFFLFYFFTLPFLSLLFIPLFYLIPFPFLILYCLYSFSLSPFPFPLLISHTIAYFNHLKTNMFVTYLLYFGYMTIVSVGIFLITGTYILTYARTNN